jgi:catechol 2,3-dioxygenase-like lactoylglutathione lyase family enzyme
MKVQRVVANIAASDPALASKFYGDMLGLDVLMDMDWIRTYGNKAKMSVQISFMSEGGSGTAVPDLSIEVDDLDAAMMKFEDAGVRIEYGPADEPWGVRRFFVKDPFGRLVNVLSHQSHDASEPMHPSAPHEAVLIRNTMAFDRQHAAEFRQAILNAVDFANKHAPQLMVMTYIDDENGLCYSFQLFRDSEAILRHWKVSDPNITEVMKHCVVRSMEVYGRPSEAVRNGILGSVGDATVSFTPELAGFFRLA